MTLARWQATIVDEAGNVLPAASVTVRKESTGALAALFSDRAGVTGVANPRTADADGFVYFYTRGGAYKITATLGAVTSEVRHVAVGTAAELDIGDLSSYAGMRYDFATSTSAGASAGTMRANNANLTAATNLYFADDDADENDNETYLAAVGNSDSTVRGHVILRKPTSGEHIIYSITGGATNGSGFVTVPVSFVSGALSLAANDEFVAVFLRTGDAGDDGEDGDFVLDIVTGSRDYYVRADGNNSNTGLADSAGGAFATWQKCADVLKTLYITTGITVRFRAGVNGLSTPITLTGSAGVDICSISGWSGGGAVEFRGDTTTPGNIKLTGSNAAVFNVRGLLGSGLTFRGFEFASSSAGGRSVRHGGIGNVHMHTNDYSTEAQVQVEAPTAYLDFEGTTNAIVGNVTLDRFVDCDAGFVYMGTGTFNIAGTVTMTSAFITARNGGKTLANGETYNVTGSVTGKRFSVDCISGIRTGGLGINHFPGNAAGTVDPGGVYDVDLHGTPALSFTAQLKFGGNSVGMTGTFTGNATRIGDWIIGDISISLTAKGSSTGSATITGLPFTAATPGGGAPFLDGVTLGSGLCPQFDCSGTSIRLRHINQTTGSNGAMDDTMFTNTSGIKLAFTYKV